MLLWRLSGKHHARALDGGYGLNFDGRWNTVGHAVTYCATSPALCVLEKLVHIEDPALLPELVMVTYEVPDAVGIEDVLLKRAPAGLAPARGLEPANRATIGMRHDRRCSYASPLRLCPLPARRI